MPTACTEHVSLVAVFDPSTLGDPQALQTQWTPLEPGGANFTTHELREDDGGLEYRKNWKLMLFGSVFFAAGLGCSLLATVTSYWVLLLGLPFLGVGGYLVWPTTIRFDQRSRTVTLRGRPIPFSRIVAVQLITERVSSDDSSDYDSHELNLVLSDGSRLNCVDHAGKQALRDDLQRLRALIGCKAWDASRR